MSPTITDHPPATALADFALGKLDTAAAERVQAHLVNCIACQAIAEHTPADSLVSLLGRAGSPRAGVHATTPAVLGSGIQTLHPVPADLPPALRDHPRYRILRLLGHGGMGVVYLAEHKVMERLVAVKVISKALVDKPETLERFHREVRAAAKLDHPNIVQAYDAEQAGDLQLLAMEFVEGKSLADVLAKKGPLPLTNACRYVRQAALGLQHAFEQGMVHRDLKPHNLMLTPKGVVKILDFGLAKVASESARPGNGLTQDNTVMGTPEYMAPEQALNSKAADIRADIYALGCTLYCLLTGRPPFTGDNPLAVLVAHAQNDLAPVESLRPEVPAKLAAVVRRLLAKDPADRPQTPKELAEALAQFAKSASKTKAAVTAVSPRRLSRPMDHPRESNATAHRRRWLEYSAVAAAALLVGAVLTGVVLKAMPAQNAEMAKDGSSEVNENELAKADIPEVPQTPDQAVVQVTPQSASPNINPSSPSSGPPVAPAPEVPPDAPPPDVPPDPPSNPPAGGNPPAPGQGVPGPGRNQPVVLVSAWMHKAGNGKPIRINLYSNHHLGQPHGAVTWEIKGNKLYLRWPNPKAPGGRWVDECKITPDGKSYHGQNQNRVIVTGQRVQ